MGQTGTVEGLGQSLNWILSIRTAVKIDVSTGAYLSLSLTINQCHEISVLHCILKIFEGFLPSCFLAISTTNFWIPYTCLFFFSISFTSASIRKAHWKSQDSIKLLGQPWGCCFCSMLAWEQTPNSHCCLNAACNQYSSLETRSFLGESWGLNIGYFLVP